LPADLAAALIPRCSELWNMYGPTESTIWSTCARVSTPDDIHIGKPIANTEIYILNAHARPQPIGVADELLIGGDGLARGYYNRPDLTAEKFVAHPFARGKRLFRTGDLARWRKDGTIEYLGRLDRQVKIRGFRIELGEIEAQLSGHPQVREKVVVAREDIPGNRQLVAYVVPDSESKPLDVDALRHFLRGKLPDYMVPGVFVLIDKLPLTPNGKIDVRALPPPDTGLIPVTSKYVPPRTTTEKRLVGIWQETLLRAPIGIRDDFFVIGGHSLLAARVFACVEREFQRRLPLSTLFERPTIEELAQILDGTSPYTEQEGWSLLVPIQPKGSAPPFFCIHGAGGNVLLYRDLARRLGDDQPFYGLQSRGLDGKTAPLTTIEEMAARYVPEILRVQQSGPFRLGGYCMGGLVAYEMARLLMEKGEEVSLLALLDTYNLSALANGLAGGHLLERLKFHCRNLSRLGLRQIPYYLSEKLRIAKDGEFLHVLSRVIPSATEVDGKSLPAPKRRSVQLANDRAAAAFKPLPYKGKVTIFKPAVNYGVFTDSDMGWAALALGGTEVIEIPVNPHAMLVEPFVSDLASALSKRLLEAAAVSG
jgi:thioesterase domain-containing protein